MSGLVNEWTSTAIDPEGGIIKNDGSYRVYRGGAWSFGTRFAWVANRSGEVSSSRDVYLGFRVAMDVSKINEALQSGRAGVIR